MSRLLQDCRLHHHAVAGGWGDEWRERTRATDRVLAAIHAGKLEPHEINRPHDRKTGGDAPLIALS